MDEEDHILATEVPDSRCGVLIPRSSSALPVSSSNPLDIGRRCKASPALEFDRRSRPISGIMATYMASDPSMMVEEIAEELEVVE